MSEIHKIEVTMMYKAFISYKFFFQSICFDNLSELAQNDSVRPILLNLQLFQSFPTKVAQNHLE